MGRIITAISVLIFTAGFVGSVSDSRAEGNWCTFICGPVPTAAPSPTPSPTPTPTPSPSPTPTPDFVVAPSGGTHTSIGAAYSAASCGDLIWVRNGTYILTSPLFLSKTCTEGNELVIQNYPGETPDVTCSNPETDAKRVNITGPYHVWDGIEVRGCYNGFNLHASNVKILNSKIHNNILFGILFVTNQGTISNVEIAGNTVELNGYAEGGTCTVGNKSSCSLQTLGGNPISAKNSHGIYLSLGNNCNSIENVHIHHNTLRHYGGRGVQTNGSECSAPDGIRDVLIEHNTFKDGSWGIALFFLTSRIEISNNTFEIDSWPTTNDSEHTFIGIWELEDSEIIDNTFSSGSSSVEPLRFYDNISGCPENNIDLNTWDVNSDNWLWNESGRSDFGSGFESVSGCGG